MVTYDHIMVRFGELSTKGKNKRDFIVRLAQNIKHALKDFSGLTFETRYDHIYVGLAGAAPEPVLTRLQGVSGIQGLSLVYKTIADIENLKKEAVSLMNNESGATFKVKAKRSDKTFPMISDQINREIGGAILKNTAWKVDVHDPDVVLSVEIREEAAYLFTRTILGAGGYPLGVGGKALVMLSGGIDSPLACYELMRRGISIEAIHFASPPYTSDAAVEKVKDLCRVLTRYQPAIRLHIVPFTVLQEAIYAHVDESYAITLMRRMMYRIAEAVAHRRKCLALANGESIGQVASQTLESMAVINAVTSLPVIRPLATVDKVEIIRRARALGTYEISIRPFEDCCTIFSPKNPKTKPHLEDVEKAEASFDFMTLVKEAIKNTESIVISESSEPSVFL